MFEFKEEPIKSNDNLYYGNKCNNSLPTSNSFENPVEPKRWPVLMILKSSGVFATRLFMDVQALPLFDAQSRSRMVWISSGTGDSEPERRLPEQILDSSSAAAALPWHARPLFLKKGRTRSRQPPAAKLFFISRRSTRLTRSYAPRRFESCCFRFCAKDETVSATTTRESAATTKIVGYAGASLGKNKDIHLVAELATAAGFDAACHSDCSEMIAAKLPGNLTTMRSLETTTTVCSVMHLLQAGEALPRTGYAEFRCLDCAHAPNKASYPGPSLSPLPPSPYSAAY